MSEEFTLQIYTADQRVAARVVQRSNGKVGTGGGDTILHALSQALDKLLDEACPMRKEGAA
jgi:hypothetical protein